MKSKELIAHATEFTFYPKGANREDISTHDFRVTVAERSPGNWAVIHSFQCWDGKEWTYENRPSDRTKKFLKKTRFPLKKAIKIALAQVDGAKINGRTYAEWQEFKKNMEEHEARMKEYREQKEKATTATVTNVPMDTRSKG